jgi:hypothetical protein
MKNITHRDYLDILKYYKIDSSHMKKTDVRKKAEHLLATKLCKCIKKRAGANAMGTSATESRAIAICYDSVIRKKGLKTFKFKCKNGARLLPKKGTRKITVIKL